MLSILAPRCKRAGCSYRATAAAAAACRRRRRQPCLAHCRKRCLDVWPFLVLYAIWAVYVGDMLWSSGREKWVLIQLGTYSLLALHVSSHKGCRRRDVGLCLTGIAVRKRCIAYH